MIDIELAIAAFKKKLSSMAYEEREEYLNKLGFVFEEENVDSKIHGEAKCIQNIWNGLSKDSLQECFIAEILSILGYNLITVVREGQDPEIEREKTIVSNSRIIECIYPTVDFDKMLNLFKKNKEKVEFLVKCRELLSKYKEKSSDEKFKNMVKNQYKKESLWKIF